MENASILYGVPRVAYGLEGLTPYPQCVKACANYLGVPMTPAQAMVESGVAFRLTWDVTGWNGGNVDIIFAFDNPEKVYACGMRAMGRAYAALWRTPETRREEFEAFIRRQIDGGNPVIALGIIGPPEACIVTGYRAGGKELLGWNFFQEYPEHHTRVRIETNGYFATEDWWDNPETKAVIATGTAQVQAFTLADVLENAAEVLTGRMCGNYAKGVFAYDAWKAALLSDAEFPHDAVFPVLAERLMCHGDAMDCLVDGRYNASRYLKEKANAHPAQAEGLKAAAGEFDALGKILTDEMVPRLGGWSRGEREMRNLANPKLRREFAAMIERMKAHDEAALQIIRELAVKLRAQEGKDR